MSGDVKVKYDFVFPDAYLRKPRTRAVQSTSALGHLQQKQKSFPVLPWKILMSAFA